MNRWVRFAVLACVGCASAMYGQVLNPSGDAYVVPANNTNFGAPPTVTIGSANSYGLVQFDLTQLPAGVTASQVQKATLTIFVGHINSAGTFNLDTVSNSTPWSESTVNGNTVIGPQTSVAVAVPVFTSSTFISVDATAAVQGWLNSPTSNNGFLFIANGSTSFQFDSKESTTTSHPATLTITLLPPQNVEFIPPGGPSQTLSVPKIVAGKVTLTGGSGGTVTFGTSFTSASSYACTVTDASSTGVTANIATASASGFSIGFYSPLGGSAGQNDTYNYICIGY
jgi:hypothetical protein